MGNTLKNELEPDVCMSQMKFRHYKKVEANYGDSVEALMDCRGDVMAIKEASDSGMSFEEKVMWFALGVVTTVLVEKNAGK